jgi:hypothetical protein
MRSGCRFPWRSEQRDESRVHRTGCGHLPPPRAGLSPFVVAECPLPLSESQQGCATSAALTRLVRKARRGAFEAGRLNAQAEREVNSEQ